MQYDRHAMYLDLLSDYIAHIMYFRNYGDNIRSELLKVEPVEQCKHMITFKSHETGEMTSQLIFDWMIESWDMEGFMGYTMEKYYRICSSPHNTKYKNLTEAADSFEGWLKFYE